MIGQTLGPRGYATVLDEMVKNTVPTGDARVKLNAKVVNISHSDSGVVVETEEGKRYEARTAFNYLPSRNPYPNPNPSAPVVYEVSLMVFIRRIETVQLDTCFGLFAVLLDSRIHSIATCPTKL